MAKVGKMTEQRVGAVRGDDDLLVAVHDDDRLVLVGLAGVFDDDGGVGGVRGDGRAERRMVYMTAVHINFRKPWHDHWRRQDWVGRGDVHIGGVRLAGWCDGIDGHLELAAVVAADEG